MADPIVLVCRLCGQPTDATVSPQELAKLGISPANVSALCRRCLG